MTDAGLECSAPLGETFGVGSACFARLKCKFQGSHGVSKLREAIRHDTVARRKDIRWPERPGSPALRPLEHGGRAPFVDHDLEA
jgi:hypothetical protein